MQIQVTAAIIFEGEKVLICQRSKDDELPLLWEFPGGKVEEGETLDQCIVRECKEELAVEINVLGEFGRTSYFHANHELCFTFFLAKIMGGTLIANVHEQFRWASPAELKDYIFCPADVGTVERIMTIPTYSRTPNKVRTPENEQLDFGWSKGWMRDGRAFYAEYWNEFGIDVVTYYFSTRGLECLTDQELAELLETEEFIRARACDGVTRKPSVTASKRMDEAGKEMWVVNVPFADEDEVWVDCLTPINGFETKGNGSNVCEAPRAMLIEQRGETVSIHIEAYIDCKTGHLVIDGQDVGSFVMDTLGDSDYEYWLTINKEHKYRLFELFAESDAEAVAAAIMQPVDSDRDKALIALIQKHFSVPDVITKLREQCDARGIPCKFTCYT